VYRTHAYIVTTGVVIPTWLHIWQTFSFSNRQSSRPGHGVGDRQPACIRTRLGSVNVPGPGHLHRHHHRPNDRRKYVISRPLYL